MEQKLADAYPKLVAYQTTDKGYEWFGTAPSNEALSAYGIMQFTEMAKVTSTVDNQMIKKVHTWLGTRKDGNGGFL